MGRKIFAEREWHKNHPQRIRLKHRGMRAKTRRADRNNVRRNRRNENGNPRIKQGREHRGSLPTKLGAINKEKTSTFISVLCYLVLFRRFRNDIIGGI